MWDPRSIKSPYGHWSKPLKKSQLFFVNHLRKAPFPSGDEFTLFHHVFQWCSPAPGSLSTSSLASLCPRFRQNTNSFLWQVLWGSPPSQAARKAQQPQRKEVGKHTQHCLGTLTAHCLFSCPWQKTSVCFQEWGRPTRLGKQHGWSGRAWVGSLGFLPFPHPVLYGVCLLYTSDAADERK